MRLGGEIFEKYTNAEEWALAVRKKGYKAAYAPVDYTVSDSEVESYKKAAKEHDIVIGEVGVWNNVLDQDAKKREENLAVAVKKLALAEELEAKCCVNIAGSYSSERWDGPHPDNFSQKAYDQVVQSVQYLIDTVKPQKTFYTFEPLAWMLPDTIEVHLELIKDIDRKAFGVHFDPVNMMYTPKIYYANGEFLKEAIRKFGKHIKSCHVKDLYMEDVFTLFIRECKPGEGVFDYPTFISEIDKLDPEMPVFVEHMHTEQEYDDAANYVRRKIAEVYR